MKDKKEKNYGFSCLFLDALTFDVIKQSPTFENGLFTDTHATGIRWNRTGKPTGDRYRYISNEDTDDGNRYFYLEENTYKTSNTRYRGERTELYINGAIAAQSTANYGAEYFSTDLLGSIRTTTDSYGTSKNTVSYDVFGSLIEGSLSSTTDHGYLGKQYDPIASLYNYGYRDYRPQSSRFTTQDPIRDGINWYAYCGGDPINNVDFDGLKITNFNAYFSMSNYSEKINGTNSNLSDSGCALTGMSNIITEVVHKENPTQIEYNENTHEGSLHSVSPHDLNVSNNFQGKTDYLDWNKTAEGYGLQAKRSSDVNDAQKLITSAQNSNKQEYVLIQVPITIGKGDGKKDTDHWVGHSGKTITKKGEVWIEIVPTSDNDTYREQKNSNWMKKNGKMYVKESAIKGAVVVKNK